jgi:hypothetical protein
VKFNIGDRVRVNCPTSLLGYHGRETVVIGIHTNKRTHHRHGIVSAPLFYQVDLPSTRVGAMILYRPHELEPIYDGNEKVSWSSCVWQPNQVRA